MRRLRPALLLGLVLAAFVSATIARAASPDDQFMASETYYTLHVESGSLSVRVEAEIQAAGPELEDVWLWAMPTAETIEVYQGDSLLEHEVEWGSAADGTPTVVIATLADPLKGSQRTNISMTYTVAPHTGEFASVEPGAMELLFLGQGPGSFVFFDLPQEADNFVDPGCLLVAHQPSEVRDAGRERWVCGETMLIAISLDDPEVIKQCSNLDDECRQRYFDGVYSGFVQSITDESKQGTLTAEVPLSERSVELTLKYFRRDEAWAQRQFEVAQEALPKLEALFGFPYQNDTLLMRESYHIALIGAAGIAFPTQGEVLLAADTGFDEEVTIHELAHQWAGFNLSAPWLWEGLAEWATSIVAPEFGITPIHDDWETIGDILGHDPLATWGRGSNIFDPRYWYGRSEAFWFAYEEAIGGRENLQAILASTDDDLSRHPLDGQWFMDEGEAISGANLDELYLGWVFLPETAGPVLAERRAAYDALVPLRERASSLGFAGLPLDMVERLKNWSFGVIDDQIVRANAALDAYVRVQELAVASGLPPSEAAKDTWTNGTIAQVQAQISMQEQTIIAITDAEVQIANEPDDSPAFAVLDEARAQYAAGDLQLAARTAADAVSEVINRDVSGGLLDVAAAKQEAFSSNFFKKVGLLFEDPDADLATAQAAYEAGDFEAALVSAQAAIDAWDGAQGRGFMRLMILTAVMAALTFGVWWLLQRASRPEPSRGIGHYLEEGSTPSWRDWENS